MNREITATDLAMGISIGAVRPSSAEWLAARRDLSMTPEVAALWDHYLETKAAHEAAIDAIYTAAGLPRPTEDQ